MSVIVGVPAMPATQETPKRLVIIPDASNIVWSAELTEKIVAWSSFRFAIDCEVIVAWPGLEVIATDPLAFRQLWEEWFEIVSDETTMPPQLSLAYITDEESFDKVVGDYGSERNMYVNGYAGEFFSVFPARSEAWTDILRNVTGLWVEESKLSLTERLVSGTIHTCYSEFSDPADEIGEVVIVEMVGGELVARCFTLPRFYDPSAMLP